MNALEKFFYISIGLVSDVSKRLDQSLKKLVKEGKLSEIDAQKILNDFKSSTEKYKNEVSKKLNELIANTVENLKLVKQQDIDELKKRIEQLEEKIKQL
jgi:polyhydroxyalkanoate synthesis regulator phasin